MNIVHINPCNMQLFVYILSLYFKIQTGLAFDRTKKTTVFVGNHWTFGCLRQPDTCGSSGGTVAFWSRVTYRDSQHRGRISSCEYTNSPKYTVFTSPTMNQEVKLKLCEVIFTSIDYSYSVVHL